MFCPKCGKQNPDNNSFCIKCGADLKTSENDEGFFNKTDEHLQYDVIMEKIDPILEGKSVKYKEAIEKNQTYIDSVNTSTLKCPKCGSENLQFVHETTKQGFDPKAACCGYIALGGPLGFLCGACGMNDTDTDEFWVCKSCGKKFTQYEIEKESGEINGKAQLLFITPDDTIDNCEMFIQKLNEELELMNKNNKTISDKRSEILDEEYKVNKQLKISVLAFVIAIILTLIIMVVLGYGEFAVIMLFVLPICAYFIMKIVIEPQFADAECMRQVNTLKELEKKQDEEIKKTEKLIKQLDTIKEAKGFFKSRKIL